MEEKKNPIKVQSFLAQLPQFQAMNPEELDRIALGASEHHVPRGETIFHAGDPCDGFYLVIYGQVKLALGSARGTEKVVELVGPGHSFGEAVMFMGKPFIVTAQALVDSLVVHVTKATILDEVAREPAFACKMLAGLSRRMHGLICDMESYSLRSGTQRVIGYLLQEEGPENGDRVRLAVTKTVLASRLNLTPEHFSRILSDLSGHGMIAVSGRNVTILDIEGLRQYG
ncbi:Crp/Fnr family transcriptional regulator [Janthinobacterium fluminis]|uniref:Crp/Fnr family transcriptional regulator n=1 Tax=Janthinobacterium fluminis TaxID=2987524 RepID=A0ABT5JYB9_9BURK|nr:Crp/Fnr family transcriptional regulator [Janthinobacterium fluminis]MDC8757046.1 Crp/Fnr family transcriptional regulator [Janthinobacterium fluminis]